MSAETHISCNQPCARSVATSVRFPGAVAASGLIAAVRSDICESPGLEPGPLTAGHLRSLPASSAPQPALAAQLAAIAGQPCRTIGPGPAVTQLNAAELTAPADAPRLELNLCAAGVSVRTLRSRPADASETPALALAAVQCATAAPLRSERWAWSDPAPILPIGSEPPTVLKAEAVHGGVEVLIDFAGEELTEAPPLECEQTCALAASIETRGHVGHRVATFSFAPVPAVGPSGETVIATIAVASNHEMLLPPHSVLRSLAP